MRSILLRAKGFYGANPLHLLALLGCFALAGYAVTFWLDDPLLPRLVIWFLAAVIGHDLVLFPLYALADWSVTGALRALKPRRAGTATALVSPLNYLRTPVLGAGLTFVLFFPGIIMQGADTVHAATGLDQTPYLGRWLLLSAAMFGASAVVYAIRLGVASKPLRATKRAARAMIRPGERVLATAGTPGQAPEAVGTTEGLYYRDGDAAWSRVGWEDLSEARWHEDDHELRIAGAEHEVIGLPVPGDLPDVVHTMITSTHVNTSVVDLGDGHRASVTVSRRPRTGELVWRTRLENGADPADPELRTRLDAAIGTLRADLGL
ncbi:MAG: hypothetical protein JWQ81_7124 [Amycolatopsis sp.]|uniref:hypothetical protein n=1 Tax=Amycolatopsis sp. TaxID=37632 RepID=UPI002604387E|nr:hypothetical protein [Amycolatopsis sp.]MCU1686385.1 hypothetical protein [Amycolatopsis sp.]